MVRPPPVFPKGSGRIAIVLDDWGYTLKQIPVLGDLRQPVTVAILPSLPHSAEVAHWALRHGHQVILHMPMEAQDPAVPQEADTLKVSMPAAELLTRLNRSLASVPGAAGISNHQGSRAMSDPRLMETVLRESGRRHLFFLDSTTTRHSVCRDVARRIGVPTAQRDVFLDNELKPEAIHRQLVLLAQKAAQRGYAVGIGHDRRVMLEVLREEMPALQKAGYTLVPISELAEEQSLRWMHSRSP